MGLLIPGGFAVLILWALLKKGKTSTTIYPPSVIPDDEPVPGKPVVIVSKPKPKPAPDVAEALENKVREEQNLSYIPGGSATQKAVEKERSELSYIPGGSTAEAAFNDAVKESAPAEHKTYAVKAMLNHNLLPRPSSPAVKFALIQTYQQAMDYAKQGFHKIVDVSTSKGPSLELAQAARAYFDVALVPSAVYSENVRVETKISDIKKMIETANLKAEKVLRR